MDHLKKLVNQCVKGNRRAQKNLYDTYAGKMLGVCMRYARDKAEAEDYLQEGFVKVFNNLHTLRDPQQLVAWMERIMINTALENIRKQKRHFKNEVFVEEQIDVGEDEQVTDEISRGELLKVIQSLPPGFRAVFNMYALEGYSHKEISDKLGITEGTSKSQYARAKTMLQKKVAKLNEAVLNRLSHE